MNLDLIGCFLYVPQAMIKRFARSMELILLAQLMFPHAGEAQESSAPARSRAGLTSKTATPPSDAVPQVVVLHNGSVIQGQVEKSRDRLVVSNGPWYVVRVPLEDVDFVAPDFSAAFRTKRARLGDGDFERNQQLAQWCLRHNLNQFAADQLQLLSRLDPHHSSVRALENELQRRADAVLAVPKTAVPKTAVPKTAVPKTAVPKTADSKTALPKTADFKTVLPKTALPKTVERVTVATPLTSSSDGEWTTSVDLPPVSSQALAEFTRSIQPLLLNRCGQTTCHGRAGANRFRLERLHASGLARRDRTLRNLRSALAQFDSARSVESSLIDHAGRPHGKRQSAPAGPREARQQQRLLDWVALLTGSQSVGIEKATVSIVSAQERATVSKSNVTAAPWFDAVKKGDVSAATAQDPFDPAEFNARFFDASTRR